MDKQNEAFLQQLMQTFYSEAQENLKILSEGLIQLENTSTSDAQQELMEAIYRAAHSLKGSARAVDLKNIEALSHAIENVFASIKEQRINYSSELFDILNNVVNVISQILKEAKDNPGNNEGFDTEKLLQQIEDLISKPKDNAPVVQKSDITEIPSVSPVDIGAKQDIASPTKLSIEEKVKIETSKLDTLLFQMEEFVSFKLTSRQRNEEIEDMLEHIMLWRKEQVKMEAKNKTFQKMLEKIEFQRPELLKEAYLKLYDFRLWEVDLAKTLELKLMTIKKNFEHEQRLLSTKIDSLLDDTKKILMQPIATVLHIIPKIARDLAHTQGKQIELIIKGSETEIDRRILEEMYEPILHLIRNSVDHGLENPELRQQQDKPEKGKIIVSTKQKSGGKIEIVIEDDGAGIQLDEIKIKAQQTGLLANNSEISENELMSLIFKSGISTSPIITDISGRGLGLAIVWEKIEKLGGSITVESQVGRGTAFHIILPITLATFKGVHVRVGESQFLIPSVHIAQCLRIHKDTIKTVEGKPTIIWQEKPLAVVGLSDVLDLLIDKPTNNNWLSIVILDVIEKKIGFSVDEILNEEEVLVKNLNKQLARVKNISAATLLGSGKVVPILNGADLIRSAIKKAGSPNHLVKEETFEMALERPKSILVVEDSITSRALLKNILESSGYAVTTAVDGLQGFTLLHSKPFDLVVSDVDMPRMNGLELTKKIREDPTYATLPIILVTALESEEDKEKGAESGANAYLIKQSFDQSNLLEIVRRLT